jgi:hypothetical protein
MSIYAIAIFVVLWIGFAVALFANRAWLDLLWDWMRALPMVMEVIVWIMFLPITVLLWIWESSWPSPLRVLGYAGLVAWTFLAVSGLKRAFQ